MRTLTDSDGLLVIQSPTWLGITLIGLAVVIAIAAVLLSKRVPRPARLGAFLGSIVVLLAGWHLIGTRTTLEPRGFYVESIYGEEQRVGWLQVSNIVAAGPKSKHVNPDHLALWLLNTNEVSIDLSGLAPEERARVVSYVKARLVR